MHYSFLSFKQDNSGPYCSTQCYNAHALHHSTASRSQPIPIGGPSSSSYSYPHRPQRSPSYSIDDQEDDYLDDPCFYPESYHHSPKHLLPIQPSQPSRSAWIGKGNAGIQAWAQDVHPGLPLEAEDDDEELSPPPRLSPCSPKSSRSPLTSTFRPPKLLQARKPKPTIYMSKTEPAPPVPSRPICTPQQTLPHLSPVHSTHSHPSQPSYPATASTNASLTSLTTGISTSIATPASEDPEDPPSAETQRPNFKFIAGLTAHLSHLASWTSSPSSPKVRYASPNVKGGALRSKTITRQPPSPIVAESSSYISSSRRQARAYSPIPFFMPDLPVTKEKYGPASSGWGEKTDEEAAFKNRGRKLNRV